MTDDTTNEIDRERIALKGHEENRQRLLDLGRSEPIVDQLEGETTFYEFAAATADAVKHDRRNHEHDEATND